MALKFVKTEWDAYFGILKLFKHYQESKIACLQNTISRLTAANKQREKRASEAFFLPVFYVSGRAAAVLCSVLNFPFPLKLSPLPPFLKTAPLKLRLLRIQINPKSLMFPGPRPDCEPELKSFLK